MIESFARHAPLLTLPQRIPPESQVTRSYHIYYLTLKIVSNDARFFDQLDPLLGCFLSSVPHVQNDAITLHFYRIPATWDDYYYDAIEEASLRHDDTPHIHCYASENAMLYRYAKHGLFLTDSRHGHHIGYILAPCSPWTYRHVVRSVFLSGLFTIMRFQGLFPIHASGLAAGRKGILITGDSGQGKTTLLLHLLKQGFRYLADDTLLVRENGQHVTMLAFPTPIRISPQAADFFPELSHVIEEHQPDEQGKYHFSPPDAEPCDVARALLPGIALFPEITPNRTSSLHPVAPIDVAAEWMAENTFAGNTTLGRENFRILSRLLQSVRCYRVCLGREMAALGRQIAEAVAEHA